MEWNMLCADKRRSAARQYDSRNDPASLLDRSSNLLCLCGADGDVAVSVGPTENMGFAPASPSQANLA